MKELTVNQFSKQTGIARSKIYYQIKINKLKINKGKINYEDALQLFSSKELVKQKNNNERDIKHILNTLNLQNLNLQRQLDLAYEREKFYLAELAAYRQIKPNNITHEDIEAERIPDRHSAAQSNELRTIDKSAIKERVNATNEISPYSEGTPSPYDEETSNEANTPCLQLKTKRPSKNHALAKATIRTKPIKVGKIQEKKNGNP